MTYHRLTGAALATVFAFASPAQAATVSFDYTGTFARYSIPTSGDYRITAYGAQGGGIGGGTGAGAGGIFTLSANDELQLHVGGHGATSACRVPAAGAPVSSSC